MKTGYGGTFSLAIQICIFVLNPPIIMKKLVYIILFLPFFVFSQEQNDPCSSNSIIDYLSDHELANKPISYQLSQGWNMVGYYGTAQNNEISVQINEESLSNGSTLEETFQVIKNVSGQFWSPEFSQLNVLTPGEGYMMYVTSEDSINLSFNAQFEMPQISGCMDCESPNYNPIATISDESCTDTLDPCSTSIIDYLSDHELANKPISYQLSQGWNMVGYYGTAQNNEISVQINEESLSNGSTLEETFQVIKNVSGQFWSPEFSQLNVLTPGEGYMMYVTSEDSINLSFNAQFEMPQISGCMDCEASNYNPLATSKETACVYSVGDHAQGGVVFYVDESGTRGLVATSEDAENVYEWGCYSEEISGAEGRFVGAGFQNTLDIIAQGCQTSDGSNTAAQVALSYEALGYMDWFLPSKDELGLLYENLNLLNMEISLDDFYWTSTRDTVYYLYDYNAFRLKHSEIFGIQTNSGWRNTPSRVLPVRAFGNWTMGCMDSLACNYNSEANMADGSCTYAEEGYDCDGNITAQIGDIMEGGYLFYIDETGKHGFVAATEDIGQFEWGCYSEDASGADASSIGSGNENTIDIVNGCSTENGGITAAQSTLDFNSEGYDDWFLPSKDELTEMYNSIGNGSAIGNIAAFSDSYYWSSTEYNIHQSWSIHLTNGSSIVGDKFHSNYFTVRPIRSF